MFRPFVRLWEEYLRLYRNVTYVRMLVLGVVLGVVSGIAATLFFLGIEYFKHLIQAVWAGYSLPAPAGEALFHGHAGETFRPWVIPLATTTVALVTGWLVSRFLPDSFHGMTDGTDSMIRAFHRQKGVIRPVAPLIKGITSIFTIASGGSAGREGPISQIGAGIGSFFADKMGLSTKERRILMLTGVAGGLGAVFRAPLGGALTAVEVIYKEDFESEAILPAVTSSVVSYSIFTLVFGTEPIFGIPEFSFNSMSELPFYLILSLVCAAAGWLYVSTFRFIKYSVFARMQQKVGIMWTMAAGGLLMGLFGMLYPKVLSGGYGWLEQAILGQMTVATMVTIILAKTLATSVTLGSGMSGGMFAPALFVGGMSGGIVGFTAHKYYPDIVTQPGGYVLVGMAAFFAGVANAPIGPLIMVCELTQGYGLLAPLMLASAVCIVLGRRSNLYENQVENKFESPAHINDATINLLEQLKVTDHFERGRVTILEESVTLKGLTDIISGTNEFFFPVKSEEGEITGILSINDVRSLLYEESLFDLVLVKDLARKPATLEEEDDLYTALLKFVDTDLGQIPVVDADDHNTILGLINRSDVFHAYTKTLQKLRED
jgi:CIC family chloride channel protein